MNDTMKSFFENAFRNEEQDGKTLMFIDPAADRESDSKQVSAQSKGDDD